MSDEIYTAVAILSSIVRTYARGCHRTILVARTLAQGGFSIVHILSDGAVESHHDALAARHFERNRSPVKILTIGFTKTTAAILYTTARIRSQQAGAVKACAAGFGQKATFVAIKLSPVSCLSRVAVA